MALSSYVDFGTSSTVGTIKGSVRQEGLMNTAEVIGWSHEVFTPTDAATGRPTGKRQHKAIMLTLPLDPAVVLLQATMYSSGTLDRVTMQCYRPSASGVEVHYFTVRLETANVVHVRIEQLNNKYPENMTHEIRAHIGLTYDQIEHTWVDGGITATDDWVETRRG